MSHRFNPEMLKKQLSENLPGREAQTLMAPPGRLDYTVEEILQRSPRLGAVMLLLFEREGEWHTLFTKRHDYEGVHSGQMSFPGGKKEEDDHSFEAAALRETMEEVGIAPEDVRVLGQLSELYIPPSHFLVYPYVGWVAGAPEFKPDPREVKELVEIPIQHFLNEDSRRKETIRTTKYELHDVPSFVYGDYIIWGATAIILSEFSVVINDIFQSKSILHDQRLK